MNFTKKSVFLAFSILKSLTPTIELKLSYILIVYFGLVIWDHFVDIIVSIFSKVLIKLHPCTHELTKHKTLHVDNYAV